MHPDLQNLDPITQQIIGAAIEVHKTLGPGLLESVYRQCMVVEMRLRSLHVEEGRKVSVEYKGHHLRAWFVMDLLVDGRVVVELEAVERLHPLHSSQVITYLKLSGLPTAVLINFNTTTIKSSVRRLYRPDLYSSRQVARPTDV